MCLDSKWSDDKKKEWLESQPKIITAYKVAEISCKRDKLLEELLGIIRYKTEIVAPFFCDLSYKQKNRIRMKRRKIEIGCNWGLKNPNKYIPYYHLFLNLTDAIAFQTHRNRAHHRDIDLIVMECKVPKKHITEIGYENGRSVVVTKSFTLVEKIKDIIENEVKHEHT